MIKELKISHNITERTPILKAYMQDLSRFPLLSIAEEVELATKSLAGDEQAKQLLIQSNLRFVISIAKQYIHQGVSLEDLIMEGNIGLMNAINKFDPTRGFKLSTYAVWWIRQSILQALADKGRTVRLPLNQVGIVTRVKKAMQHFMQINERYPTTAELAELLELPEDKIEDTLRTIHSEISIDTPIGEDGDICIADTLSSSLPETDSVLQMESLRMDIERWLLLLKNDERAKDILIHFYGLNGKQPMTFEELAYKHDISRERVRQIHQHAIQTLKKHVSR
jgi:RNA polymerase primary sigma factor